MSKFVINGGAHLSGEVEISGSKNAALPLVFATVVTHGRSVIHNLPHISDVDVALSIISSMGARVSREDSDAYIDSSDMRYERPSDLLVSKIRASSYLLGACLARFGISYIQPFGGCNFDSRPVDMHLYAMKSMGGIDMGDFFIAKGLSASDIYFDRISVGATVNALLLASSAKGRSRIFGYAREPHVIALTEYLKAAGAGITLFEDRIEVEGGELSGAEATVIPDMIEAGTFAAISLLTDSPFTVKNGGAEQLKSFFSPLMRSGALLSVRDGDITLSGGLSSFLEVVTEPYPGFPTDLQPQTAPLMARYSGGRIEERVWRSRFGYLSELKKFGLEYTSGDGYALISPSRLHSARVKAPDLRGGAAQLMCALLVEGESVIDSAEIIKRGYSDISGKLRLLGADIEECD